MRRSYDSGIQLTEKEVETDHLKTVVLALNQKIQITNDIQTDLDTKGDMFAKSEEARQALQAQLRDYIQRSEEDSHKNKQF